MGASVTLGILCFFSLQVEILTSFIEPCLTKTA